MTQRNQRRDREDLTGQHFGARTVIEPRPNKKWLVECICGARAVVAAADLKRGCARSCVRCSRRAVQLEQPPAPTGARWIQLGRRSVFALVDAADYAALVRYRWYLNPGEGHAYRHVPKPDGKLRSIQMHRHILGVKNPLVFVDHINGDRLDNRRGNLRRATAAQNAHNRGARRTSKGVWLVHHYSAQIMVRGRRISLGLFSTAKAAALAYNRAAKKLHGRFARLNKVRP